ARNSWRCCAMTSGPPPTRPTLPSRSCSMPRRSRTCADFRTAACAIPSWRFSSGAKARSPWRSTVNHNQATIGANIWLAFFCYVVLLAGRDVASELFLGDENPIALAWFICTTIFVLALVLLLVTGGLPPLLRKLRDPKNCAFGAVQGLLATVIYA